MNTCVSAAPVAAFKKIAEEKALFASTADDSGTHKAQLRLWSAAGVDPKPGSGKWFSKPAPAWGPHKCATNAAGQAAPTARLGVRGSGCLVSTRTKPI